MAEDQVQTCLYVKLQLLEALYLRLVPGGAVVAGPPCSLFVGACQSIHRRTRSCPLGDTRNLKVRLSNLIWDNFAA